MSFECCTVQKGDVELRIRIVLIRNASQFLVGESVNLVEVRFFGEDMYGIAACRSLPGNPDTPSMAVSACEKNVIPRTCLDQIENGDSMPAKIVDKFFQHDSFGFMGTARRSSPIRL